VEIIDDNAPAALRFGNDTKGMRHITEPIAELVFPGSMLSVGERFLFDGTDPLTLPVSWKAAGFVVNGACMVPISWMTEAATFLLAHGSLFARLERARFGALAGLALERPERSRQVAARNGISIC